VLTAHRVPKDTFRACDSRAFEYRVEADNDVMIAGLIVQSINEQVIVRALGPTLANFGITNPLADPTLSLLDANGTVLAFNDNWKNTQQAEITATVNAPPDDRESAIMRTAGAGQLHRRRAWDEQHYWISARRSLRPTVKTMLLN